MTQNAQLSPFDLFSFDFTFLYVHKYFKKWRYQIWTSTRGVVCFFVRKSTIMGCNHFCRMCVTCGYNPKFTKVPLISLFNVGMCFLRCVFLSKCNTIFKVPYIYTSRNCLHLNIRPWFRDCCNSPFLSISASVLKKLFVTAHVSPSPLPPLCVELLVKCVLWCTIWKLV